MVFIITVSGRDSHPAQICVLRMQSHSHRAPPAHASRKAMSNVRQTAGYQQRQAMPGHGEKLPDWHERPRLTSTGMPGKFSPSPGRRWRTSRNRATNRKKDRRRPKPKKKPRKQEDEATTQDAHHRRDLVCRQTGGELGRCSLRASSQQLRGEMHTHSASVSGAQRRRL